MTPLTSQLRSAYITHGPERGGTVDREAALHHRRKAAMISLLSEFEREIEPHITGHRKAIDDFKRSCRAKLNAVTFEAIELLRLEDGEDLNAHAVDLAERLAFGDNDGGPE